MHPIFISDVFYPIRPWRSNQFAALADSTSRLVVMPGQYRNAIHCAQHGRGGASPEVRLPPLLQRQRHRLSQPRRLWGHRAGPGRAAAIVWIASRIGDDGVAFLRPGHRAPSLSIRRLVTYTSVNPADPCFRTLAAVAGSGPSGGRLHPLAAHWRCCQPADLMRKYVVSGQQR
ncbi:MAG: hypothetical protein R2838_17005 [Caldilineaceae bacterium]